jgi:Co/Zn/Cd efflux system component
MHTTEATPLKISTWHIPGMDCPSEEQVIRMKLSGMDEIRHLEFDLPGRRLRIWYSSEPEELKPILESLNWGTRHESLADAGSDSGFLSSAAPERKLLWQVLWINAGFFAAESVAALVSGSTGLFADGLDMLADAMVYGLALFATGRGAQASKRVARAAGMLQLSLAILGFAEVIRRFTGSEPAPDHAFMVVVSIFALIGNYVSLRILRKTQSSAAHIRASEIFTSNDILVNACVILAGGLVWFSGQAWPDLLVGSIVFVLVMRGARNIFKLG